VLYIFVYVGMLSPGFSDAVQVQAAAALEKGQSIEPLLLLLIILQMASMIHTVVVLLRGITHSLSYLCYTLATSIPAVVALCSFNDKHGH
jgi:hypothetical protein